MLGNIGLPQLVIILVIVLVLFGAKRLRNVGGDLGTAVKGFKNAVKEEGDESAAQIENTAERVGEEVEKEKKEV